MSEVIEIAIKRISRVWARGFGLQVSVQPLAADAARLIEQEILKKRISNIESGHGVKYRMSKE